jgi:hypothetical protein
MHNVTADVEYDEYLQNWVSFSSSWHKFSGTFGKEVKTVSAVHLTARYKTAVAAPSLLNIVSIFSNISYKTEFQYQNVKLHWLRSLLICSQGHLPCWYVWRQITKYYRSAFIWNDLHNKMHENLPLFLGLFWENTHARTHTHIYGLFKHPRQNANISHLILNSFAYECIMLFADLLMFQQLNSQQFFIVTCLYILN